MKQLLKCLGWFFAPLMKNATFFIFMYILGVVCAWATLPDTRGAEIYGNLYLELFLDLYVLCLVLTAIPRRVRPWARALLYVVLYAAALADVYCFVKFDSTLNPSMLMIVGETDAREASEFVSALVSADVIFSSVGIILLLLVINLMVGLLPRMGWLKRRKWMQGVATAKQRAESALLRATPVLGVATLALLVWSAITSYDNKRLTHELMSERTIGEVEHALTRKDRANLYTPISRLLFSLYANSLADQQVETLIAAARKVTVDSCSFRSPTIVLIIGESYGKHHSQQYGYPLETTPRQVMWQRRGNLVKFDDVVSCWNLTSFVFKNVFSLHVVGQQGEWCDYPLFPEVFRKAGYHVTFLTNQFLPQAKQAVYDFSGGFFLNNSELSREQFDTRNTELHRYDDGLLADYDRFVKNGDIRPDGHNLVIFHLIGQHVNYRDRYPAKRAHFWASTYDDLRPNLTNRQKKILSYYDNAVLYNDSIVDRIIRKFSKQEAIVVYMPDHGEECYEDDRGFICRNHSAQIDYPLAKYEFEIPFWIYCSPKYIRRHRDIYREVVQARQRRFMTDALPHLLLYLAGIHCPDYHSEYNLLSPDYDERRPRILKNTTDYDKIRPTALAK